MTYPVIELVNQAYYTSGVVSRDFQTVTGSQINDGINFLNDIITDKTVENNMIPYATKYSFNAVPAQYNYFIPNLIQIETLVFFINSVRYQMNPIPRHQFFGTSRADNIQSLPFTWHTERQVGGSMLFLYFLPDVNYPMEIWGQFRLTEVAINQDLMSDLTTVNLGNVILTGTGTLAPLQFTINGIDLAGNYATAQALVNQINAIVTSVRASLTTNMLTLYSPNNIIIGTSGVAVSTLNTITFQNYSTISNDHSIATQLFFPMVLDRFYISYLKYALAKRICIEFDYSVPQGLMGQLKQYEMWISKRSQQLDLRASHITTLGAKSGLNYAQINLGRGWTI